MTDAEPISMLCPPAMDREARKLRQHMNGIVAKVVQRAANTRSHTDLLLEVYLAGIWHGSEIVRQRAGLSPDEFLALPAAEARASRKPDYLDMTSKPRRGRPRKEPAAGRPPPSARKPRRETNYDR